MPVLGFTFESTAILILKGTPTPDPFSLLTHRSCLESQSLVEGIGSGLVLGSEPLDSRLGAGASRLGGIVGTADVGELVADELTRLVSAGVRLHYSLGSSFEFHLRW